jgi:hypothetical protein
MTYDLERLALKTRKNKTDFLTRFILLALSTLIFLLLAFLSNIDEVKFLSGASLFVILLLLIRLFDKFNPKVLFSREIKGENIKEDENEIMRRGSYKSGSLPHRQVGSRTVGTRSGAAPIAPSTRANKKRFHKDQHFSGEVYLRENDGNIALITGLYISQMEIYREGDILLKPAGCKFPIVISRDTERQPCPLCGEINGIERDACPLCGLEISK